MEELHLKDFCLDSLCGYLIHALTNISINADDEPRNAIFSNTGSLSTSYTHSIGSRQSAGKSLAGGHISVTSSPISSKELSSVFFDHIPPPLIDEISDHLTKMSMAKVLISPIKSCFHLYIECEEFLRHSRSREKRELFSRIRFLEILDEDVVVSTGRDEAPHTHLPQVDCLSVLISNKLLHLTLMFNAIRKLRLEWRRDFNHRFFNKFSCMKRLTSLTLFGLEIDASFLSALIALEDRLCSLHLIDCVTPSPRYDEDGLLLNDLILLTQFSYLRVFSFVAPAARDTMLQILALTLPAVEELNLSVRTSSKNREEMRYEFESHVEALFNFLDSHPKLKTVVLLNHDVCQRPELHSGWYTRQYSGYKTHYDKEHVHQDDVAICGNSSENQIQNAFQHVKETKSNVGVFGLLMRQITLQCCSAFAFPVFREMSASALTFPSKLFVFHAMQHRFYAGSNDPLSRERFRHLQYRSALSSQIHALPNDRLRLMILEAVEATLTEPRLGFSCVDAPFVLHAIRGHIVYWRDPPFNQIEKLWPFNQNFMTQMCPETIHAASEPDLCLLCLIGNISLALRLMIDIQQSSTRRAVKQQSQQQQQPDQQRRLVRRASKENNDPPAPVSSVSSFQRYGFS